MASLVNCTAVLILCVPSKYRIMASLGKTRDMHFESEHHRLISEDELIVLWEEPSLIKNIFIYF